MFRHSNSHQVVSFLFLGIHSCYLENSIWYVAVCGLKMFESLWNNSLAHKQFSLSGDQLGTHLAPDEHRSKDDLEAVKEVVSNDDDGSTPCGPAFTGADGFDTGCCCRNHT